MSTTSSATPKQLEPGRELDKIIAVQLMGYERFECEFTATPMWRSPDGTEYAESETFFNFIAFSTDIAAAWQVVEKVTDLNPNYYGFELTFLGSCKDDKCEVHGLDSEVKKWRVWFFHGPENIPLRREAETAPHAICLAALAAVG